MDTETLRRVQLTQLEILKELDRICKSNNIKYWLDSGTLLGAIRHKGFIPWDDDLDIGMLRPDYQRFVELCNTESSKMYHLYTWDNCEEHPFSFAKFRKEGTVYQEFKDEATKHNGIYIDVFPYDKMPSDLDLQRKQGKNVDLLKRMFLVKKGYKPWKTLKGFDFRRAIGFIPIRFLALFNSEDSLKKKFLAAQTKYDDLKSGYSYFPSGVSRYGKWVMDSDILENLSEAKFEDGYFPVPGDPDKYLKKGYGDYMKLPPEEQRSVGHSVVRVEF